MKGLILFAAAGMVASLCDAAPPSAKPALPSGMAPCESCHGAQGEGNAAMAAPGIAGQSPGYLARQLALYAEGKRPNALMAPIAQGLDEKQRRAFAAYYAALGSPTAAAAKPGPAAQRGALLATRGDHAAGVQACANCHGPEGIGEPPSYPALAGQPRSYLLAALRAWRDGTRGTDPTGQMPTIAKRLSDADIASLADYYAALPPSDQASFAIAPPRVPPPAPARPAGAGTPPAQSGPAGTEQGEPTTGGSQGPGGGGATRESR